MRSLKRAKIKATHKNRATCPKLTKALREKRGNKRQRTNVVRKRGGVIEDKTFLRSWFG